MNRTSITAVINGTMSESTCPKNTVLTDEETDATGCESISELAVIKPNRTPTIHRTLKMKMPKRKEHMSDR